MTLNSDRLSTDNPTINHIQIIEDKTKLIIKSLWNEINIQVPKVSKIIEPNKQMVRSTEITICKSKKIRAEEKLVFTLLKKRE